MVCHSYLARLTPVERISGWARLEYSTTTQNEATTIVYRWFNLFPELRRAMPGDRERLRVIAKDRGRRYSWGLGYLLLPSTRRTRGWNS
jgi:hypothetical protein